MLRATTVRLLSMISIFAFDSHPGRADYDADNLGRSLRQSLSTVRRTEKAEVEYLRRNTQGRSSAETRFNEFRNQGQGIRPDGTLATKTINVSVENRELQQVIAKEFGGAVSKLTATGDMSEIDKVESRYQSSGVNPNALRSLIPKEIFGADAGALTETAPSQVPSHPAEVGAPADPLSQFKTAASKAVESVNAQLAAEAKLDPLPEIRRAQEEAREKLLADQQKLAQDQAAADKAAAAGGGGGKGGGGNGSGGGGNGGGGDGPKAPKLADGGKGLVPEFDPGKIKPPQEESPLGGGANPSEPNGKPSDFNINPMTMSNSGMPRNPASSFGDTGEVPKGLQLGGAKSTPQSLTMGNGGPIPPTNAAGGSGPQGNAPMGAGNGGGSGGISGDPYAGVGVEKPYRAQNFNLSKDAGYAKGGGEGGGDADAASAEASVDGGGAQDAYANVTRPGQYLPRATDNNNNGGYPGIFAYRGYLVKMCTVGEVRSRLPLCRREFTYQTAKAPSEPPTSYIAAVNKETK